MSIALIFVMNFLLAVSTTVGMTLVPFLVTDSLGYSFIILGLIEGFTELLSNVLRLSNGYLFDKIKKKRSLFVISTGLALSAKALLLIPTAWSIIASKSLERMANGAFASPRDALIAEKSKNNKGFALGLLNVSKSVGCIIGPIAVSLSTVFLGDLKDNVNILIMFCCSLVIPAFLFSFLLKVDSIKKEAHFKMKDIAKVLVKIKPVLTLSFIFFLSRFNDGLLMMFLKSKGFPEWFYLSTISVFNAMMIVSSPFIGSRIDAGKVKSMITLVILSMITFQAIYSNIEGLSWVLAVIGLLLWGIQRGGSQIVFSYMIFSRVEKGSYGTSIGLYYVVTGIASLIASTIAGYLACIGFKFVFLFSMISALASYLYFLKINDKILLK